MSWMKRTTTASFDAQEFLSGMLPEWFADAVDAGMPESTMLERLRAFALESEQSVAQEEGRPADLTPPTEDYLRHTYALYCDLLKELRGA